MRLRLLYGIRVLLTINFVVCSILTIVILFCNNQLKCDEMEEKETNKRRSEVKLPQFAGDAMDGPVIYAITPTYARWTQKADLTRLSQTLLHVKSFHWIVVEDAAEKTELVTNFLLNCGLQYTHLSAKTETTFKLKDNDPNWLLPRGVRQRNRGLEWIRSNVPRTSAGWLYFMDDDNTYSLRLFAEIRATDVASVWPVGLSGGLKFEGPSRCSRDHVEEWYTAWKPERPFPIDMAGFAVRVSLLFAHPAAQYSNQVPRGYLESDFLTKLNLSRRDVEPKANLCSEILVWHTRTEKAKMKQEDKLIRMGKPSNPHMEV